MIPTVPVPTPTNSASILISTGGYEKVWYPEPVLENSTYFLLLKSLSVSSASGSATVTLKLSTTLPEPPLRLVIPILCQVFVAVK